MTLLEALKDIRESLPIRSLFGICHQLGIRGANTVEFLFLCEKWPEFSGDSESPVPGGRKAYHETESGDMWNPDHEYGAARLRLLDWCIETLEERMNNNV